MNQNNKNNKNKNEVKKIIPSKLETGFQQFLYRNLGKHIPEQMTPNQMTLVGALGGLFGIICSFLANKSPYFFIGTIIGLVIHIIADDLDGYIARKRSMTSRAGAFFDLIADILFITYLIIALSFSNYLSIQVAIFLVPVYAILMVTAMHYILNLNEFLFPRLGPIETHLCFILICIGCMIWGKQPILTIFDVKLKLADVLLMLGGIPMYFEMIRLQIQLFQRLSKLDQTGDNNGYK